jgi:hypothetical protein
MGDSKFTKEELNLRTLKLKSLRNEAEEVLRSTIQFFFDSAKPNQHAAGSGILFNIDERYFILTAAHVYSEQHEKLYIVASGEAISLGGMLYTTPLPKSGSRLYDKIDLAVIEIENVIANKIETEFKFIKLVDIELGHLVDKQSRYLSVGYPLTKTKRIWGKDELKSQPSALILSPTLKFNYEKFGFSFNTHIAVDFNRKIISENNQTPHFSPSLEGISGSGLWYLPDFLNKESNYCKKLIGIIIEKVNGPSGNAIIATRIDLITELLRQQLLLSAIPKSKAMKMNLK